MCQTSAISILLGLHVGLANPNHILNSHSFEPSPNPLLQHQVSQGLGSHQPCSPPRKTMLKYALMKNNNNVISACAFFALVFGLVYTCNRNSIHGVARKNNKSVSFVAREKKMTTMKKTTETYQNQLNMLIEKTKRTLTRNSTDCVCTSRQNLIAYTNCPGWPGHNQGAGIKDRMNILRYMFWFADELCAKVVLRCSPKVWLSEAHDCYAPKEATWDNYFTPIRSMNGTLRQVSNILLLNPNPESLFENRTVIRSEEPTIQDYESARRLKSHDESFVWVFNGNFWSTEFYTPHHLWPKPPFTHFNYSDQCDVVNFGSSIESLNVAWILIEMIGIKTPKEYVTLHLRRGDYRECDTDPQTVVEYIMCSMYDDRDVKKVVVLTNGNHFYTEKLTATFLELLPDKEIIILDRITKSQLFLDKLENSSLVTGQQLLDDNCFRFSAEKVLIQFAKFHLERGHISCASCDYKGVHSALPII